MISRMILAAALTVGGIAQADEAKKDAKAPMDAKTELKDAKGATVGTATFTEAKGGVKVSVQVTKQAPGKHGIHIHEVGKCEGPEFKSAGGHFNPAHKKHGLSNPEGSHGGDLPNLEVAADGTGKADFTAQNVTLGTGENSLLKPDGTALVIHATVDDEKSDPAGNSGARIACGVIGK